MHGGVLSECCVLISKLLLQQVVVPYLPSLGPVRLNKHVCSMTQSTATHDQPPTVVAPHLARVTADDVAEIVKSNREGVAVVDVRNDEVRLIVHASDPFHTRSIQRAAAYGVLSRG
jgi:hypothetical protein